MLAQLLPALLLSGADPVFVLAAASTQESMEEVARSFEKEHGVPVRFSFAGSNELARQANAGAQADLFLSADERWAAAVKGKEQVVLLSNGLVLVAKGTGGPTLLAAKRLCVADPEAVPVGRYAKAWLQQQELWEAVRPKVVPLLDAPSVAAAVRSGACPLGIVYRTDAAGLTVVDAPKEKEGPPIAYVLTWLASSRHPKAEALFAYLRGPGARAIFVRHGFLWSGR